MPEWKTYVRERLGLLSGTPAEQEEIVNELASHLEEHYAVLLATGIKEQEACHQTCAQAGEWTALRRGIALAKQEGPMADRVKQLWIPSLITLFTSFAALALLLWAGTKPVRSSPGGPRGLILYIPWLLLLPVIGAAGGYLSRRAHGTGWRVYVAGAFPALAIAMVFLMTFPFALVIDPTVVHDFAFIALATMTISWVVLPGIALCIGVILQDRLTSQRENR